MSEAQSAGRPDSGPGQEILRLLEHALKPVEPPATFVDQLEQKLGADAKVNDPPSIIMFRDHLTYLHEVMPQERVQLGLLDVARQLKDKQEEFAKKQGVIYYGERMGYRLGSEAICHSKMLESYAEPGQLIVGTDSHTPHSGAIGVAAFAASPSAFLRMMLVTLPIPSCTFARCSTISAIVH